MRPTREARVRLRLVDYSLVSQEDLLQICADRENAQAWQEFVRRFQPVICHTVQRILRGIFQSAESGAVDDLVQEVFLKLAGPTLERFDERRGVPAEAYIRTIASHVVRDWLKAARSHKRGFGAQPAILESVQDLPQQNNRGLASLDHHLFMAEIEEHVRAIMIEQNRPERDRTIFWLYYRNGLTASEIASIPQMRLSSKGVESLIARLTVAIRNRIVNAGIPGAPLSGQCP
jgi:RNA polymerase sigma-70 factor (ECF subfamily)